MPIELLGTIFFILLLTALILPFIFRKKKKSTYSIPIRDTEESKPCPLCGSPLMKGERVQSRMIENKGDLLMHIFGCPYCYPAHQHYKGGAKAFKKICPRCKREVGENDKLIARVFEKPEKTHVHVLGCHQCRKEK